MSSTPAAAPKMRTDRARPLVLPLLRREGGGWEMTLTFLLADALTNNARDDGVEEGEDEAAMATNTRAAMVAVVVVVDGDNDDDDDDDGGRLLLRRVRRIILGLEEVNCTAGGDDAVWEYSIILFLLIIDSAFRRFNRNRASLRCYYYYHFQNVGWRTIVESRVCSHKKAD